MTTTRGPATDESTKPVPLEQVSRLDAYLDQLVGERRGSARELGAEELVASILAAQLRLVRDDVEAPSADFLARLDREVAKAIETAERTPRRARLSRRGFLRGAATLAGGVGDRRRGQRRADSGPASRSNQTSSSPPHAPSGTTSRRSTSCRRAP